MNTFIVNGKAETPPVLPISKDKHLGELLREIRTHFNTSTSLISSIELDGMILTETEEKSLESLPLSEILSVEIHVCHPRELAEDTLQTALSFLDDLWELTAESIKEVSDGNVTQSLPQLLEGISVFSEAILRVRQLLKVQKLERVDPLESDLTAALKQILSAYEKKHFLEVAAILELSLRPNLAAWRDSGIPALIASRDC